MTISSQPSPYSHSHSAPQLGKIRKLKHKHDPSTPRILPESVNVTVTDLLNYHINNKLETNLSTKQQEDVYPEQPKKLTPFDHNIEVPDEKCLFEETPSVDSGSASDSFEFQISNSNFTFIPGDGILANDARFIDAFNYPNGSNNLPTIPADVSYAFVAAESTTTEPIVDTINPIVFNIPQNELPYVDTDMGKIHYKGSIDDLLSLKTENNPDISFCADYHPEVQWKDVSLSRRCEHNTVDDVIPLETYVYEKVEEISLKKASRIPKSKRTRPKFTSTKQLQCRIDNYYKCVSNEIENTGAMAKSKMYELGYRLVDASYFKNNIITPLLPNNADIEDFNSVQGDNGYIYEYSGAETASDLLAMRWTHQRQNFYEPKIVRYRINEETGKIVDKEALCPYCPVDVTNGLDKCFHNINMSHYMHHVCKNHGVFSTGEEMPVPAFCEKGNKYYSYCSTCGEYQKLSIRLAADCTKANDNGLISYFRHQYKEHNRTRKMRNATEKEALQRWYSESTSPLIYEPEIPCE
ncbi:hypothetical protein CANINC_000096 [Pichia inconspicua]|uniref:Transcription regulator Rua1 C-terminal domain-containing protein n=1 Tax=Pichia inconspicua TaxID=52247 RepID=A0A4T0X708_9ASCO|nr:hypothetical protein CANINC_000096 [[Candida] inconspicua]